MRAVQEELKFDVAPSFGDLLKRIDNNNLTVLFSKRLKKSWHVKFISRQKKRILVVPVFIENAPENVKIALINWASIIKHDKRSREFIKQKKSLERTIWDYFLCLGISLERGSRINPQIYKRSTKGTLYDLQEVFEAVNRQYFDGSVQAYARWGKYASAVSYMSVRKDSRGNSYNLITVAGAYNHPKVPRFAIEGVVYHEMLHIIIPEFRNNGRRIIHGPELRKKEREYPNFKEWKEWEKREFWRCIRSLKHMKH